MTRKVVIAPIQYFYSDYRNPFPNKATLEGGYTLEKFNPVLLEPAFEFFHKTFSERDKDDLRNCDYAIFHRYSANDVSPQIPSGIAANINRIILSLRITKKTRATATMFHFFTRGHIMDAHQVVQHPTINITFPPGAPPGSQFFTKNDAYKVRKYWRGVKFLFDNFSGKYHKVLNAIFFFEVGHQNHLYKPRLAHFVTSLESLFNVRDQEIGRTMRVRCSRFLGKSPQKRSRLSDEIRDIYSLRSLFVHGQGAPDRILRNEALQNQILSRAEDISRSCLQKILDKELIAVFGDIGNLEKEFQKMDLGDKSALS